MRLVTIAALIAGCLLAGCRSTPENRFYTLNMAPSGQVKSGLAIDVEPLRTSEALARRDILIKKTPTEVEYYAVDQWAADPGELVTEKLAAEFGHRPDASNRVRVGGQVLGFEQVDTANGAEAHIKLDLTFRKADASRLDEPALKKTYELSLPAQGGGPSSVARALSDGLERLATEIAADANGL
ncbi:MAG: ABC-type transport auxiliary lipoprotein family protein [FCB group bacterium]|jgi:uncharacterized lipoprotein YmbA|nr:ABC-type transport auxiliary lipoprotein family protein [FCB group bacterium]